MKKSNNKLQKQNVKVMPSPSEGDDGLQDQPPKSEGNPDSQRDGDWSSTSCSALGFSVPQTEEEWFAEMDAWNAEPCDPNFIGGGGTVIKNQQDLRSVKKLFQKFFEECEGQMRLSYSLYRHKI